MSGPALQRQQLSYFGKLPSRGDFVKGHANPQLIKVLDQWLSQAMELLAEDPRWKSIYDSAPAVHFVCLGSRGGLAIAGHLRPSSDGSTRRFPFLVAVPLDVERALDFMVGAPALLGSWWRATRDAVEALGLCSEPELPLRCLEATTLQVGTTFGASTYRVAYDAFASTRSLLGIEQLLAFDGHMVSMRRLILALGLLLQPVQASNATHLEKGLALPLPRDSASQDLLATFWLDLMAGFFAGSDFELVLFIAPVQGLMRLVVGFNGLSPKSLQGVIHPQVHAEQNIEIDNPEWVEQSVHSNHAMYKLVSYLEQPQLPLAVVRQAFHDAFIGD